MKEPILSPPQLQLDRERNDASSTPSFRIGKEAIPIEKGYNGSRLTLDERQLLGSMNVQPEDVVSNHDPDDYAKSPLFEIRDGAKESSEEVTEEEARALAIQLDCDGSRLTPGQRRAIFMRYFAMHLKHVGLRSPQYFEDKSQCLSVSETAWPGAVAYLKAESLKKAYFEPEELIERLRKLKHSNNFKLRKRFHPLMSWAESPLFEKIGLRKGGPEPDWLMLQRGGVRDMERRLGRRSTERIVREINERWNRFTRDIEQTPTRDLHLLTDIGHSPGGTLFPRYLVKGLQALRKEADDKGEENYDEENEKAKVKREEAIDRWRERNPDMILADDPVSLYRTWPADLMDELDEIDREAIRCGWRKYMALLTETEKEMQTLIAFWGDCGLINGQRASPSCYPDPKAKVRQLPMPQYLKERLDAINAQFGYFTDKGKKLRMIETSRWKEAIINSDSKPTASDPPLPQSLLDELDIVWQERDWLDGDDTEDEMIARIREWRKSKHEQCASPLQNVRGTERSRNGTPLRANASGAIMTPEESPQLPEMPSRGAYRRSPESRTKIMMAEDPDTWQGRLRSRPNRTIWQDRLRSRGGAVGAPRGKPKEAAERPTVKPTRIVKQYVGNAWTKKRQAATNDHATKSSSQTADTGCQSSPQSLDEGTPQAIPASITKSKGVRRRIPCLVRTIQPQGVQKAHNTKARHPRGFRGAVLTTKCAQNLVRLPTPPQSV